MLTHEGRLHALITRYTELTNRNELDWEATSDTDTFWADVPPDNGVSVESTAGGYPYTFTIFARDPSGAAHGQWSPIETIRTLGPEDRVGPWDEPVRELFLAARMQALDISGTVTRMLEGIGIDPQSVPPKPQRDDDIPF